MNQFRMIHFFAPRFREVIDAEAARRHRRARGAGALRINPIELVPAEMIGGVRPGDERFTSVTARRPVMEAVIARARRRAAGDRPCGAAPRSRVCSRTDKRSRRSARRRRPHRRRRGAARRPRGRRRAAVAPRCRQLLDAIGARPVIEEIEDSRLRVLRAPLPFGRRLDSAGVRCRILMPCGSSLDSHAARRQRHVGRRHHHERARTPPCAPREGRRHVDAAWSRLSARRALGRRRTARRRRPVMAKIEDRHRSVRRRRHADRDRRARSRRLVGVHQSVGRTRHRRSGSSTRSRSATSCTTRRSTSRGARVALARGDASDRRAVVPRHARRSTDSRLAEIDAASIGKP